MTDSARPGGDHLTWVGHGTVVLALGGTRVIVDPVLRPRLLHLRRFHRVPPHALRSLDAVLITHLHHDHLDPPSLERIGKDVPLVVPRGAAPLLRRKRFTQVMEIERDEEIRIGAMTVRATPAAHDSRRDVPVGGSSAEPLGYVFDHERRIYVPGDTDLFDDMERIGPVDLACLPVAGWGPKLGPGHLDPTRAAEAARRISAKVAIPIHWGTLWPIGMGSPPTDPPERFRAEARTIAPGTTVEVLPPGGTLELD